MSELTEFILARIAEDETELDDSRLDSDVPEWWMPRWLTKPRAQAELAALRAVVELHHEYLGVCTHCVDAFAPEKRESWPCSTLRALAAIWSDHEDYRPEEWA